MLAELGKQMLTQTGKTAEDQYFVEGREIQLTILFSPQLFKQNGNTKKL